MTVKAIVGGLVGDEGKGKITDIVSENADAVVRWQGGANAGHTVVNEHGSFKMHLFPSGAFNSNTLNIIGPAVAFDPVQFFEEYDKLANDGFRPNVLISDRVKILFPFHKYLNKIEEEHLGKGNFGSTCKGITPFAMDVAGKMAITMEEVLNCEYEHELTNKINRTIELKNVMLKNYYHKDLIDASESAKAIFSMKNRLMPLVGDVRLVLKKMIKSGKNIVFEGQLGSIRDVCMGIYPHISSSPSFLAGYAPVSCGLPHNCLEEVICVVKAYVSYVGSGAFPTEMDSIFADPFREKAGEYGTTSGRPRRLGYTDCVMAKYGVELHGSTEVYLTCLDLMDDWDEIPICVAYYDCRNGTTTKEFPTPEALSHMSPIYRVLPGWKESTSSVRSWENLPDKAKDFINFLEENIECNISYVSVGKDRSAMIRKNESKVF